MNASSPSEARLVAIVDSLTFGFQTLLSSLRAHRELEKTLRQRLEFAANEVWIGLFLPSFLFCHDESLLISSRSRAASVAMSDICMYYLNLLFLHISLLFTT